MIFGTKYTFKKKVRFREQIVKTYIFVKKDYFEATLASKTYKN